MIYSIRRLRVKEFLHLAPVTWLKAGSACWLYQKAGQES